MRAIPDLGHDKRNAKLKAIQEDAPDKIKLFLRVYRGKATKSEAIMATCCDCLSMDENAIAECSAPTCPLWEFRPYKESSTNKKGGVQ